MLNYYLDSKEEKEIQKISESQFKGISKLFKDMKIIFSEGERKEIFLVSEKLFDTYKKIKKKKHPFSIGFYFGEVDKGEIKFSFESIDKYAKYSDFHKIVINRKFEQKFLHGRNPHNQSVVSYDTNLKKGDTAIICNSLNEALGMGVVTGDFDSKKRIQVVKNIMDLGWFLRHKE